MTQRPLVVITDSDLPSPGAEERVLEAVGFAVERAHCSTEDDVIEAGRQADALIVQWAPITDRVLGQLARCKFVSRLGIGWDMIDVAAATRHGVAVANTPDYCIEEVAAHSVALALAVTRGIVGLDRSVRDHAWSATENMPIVARPSAARYAVIGFGRIGSRVAEIARSLGYRVVVHDPYVPDRLIAGLGFAVSTFEDALDDATVVSLHLPLTDQTRYLLDEAALGRMRKGACLVNASRGGLIDEAALSRALCAGTIAGAGLDVFAREPLPGDSPLREAPNLVLTPHAAWYSTEALAELPVRAAEQVVQFFAGSPPTSILNPDYAGVAS